MKPVALKISVAAAVCALLAPVLPLFASGRSGAELFQEHCGICHSDGGNIMNPARTLSKKDREANGIITAEDIIRKMRNPGQTSSRMEAWSGMQIFDENRLSNEDAQKIADYILKTFK